MTQHAGRILIVDDDPIVSGMLGITLEIAGYEFAEVNSGNEALEQLASLASESMPDIVVLDIEMFNGIDGFEVCRQLKANPKTRHIPVIFLTSSSVLTHEQQGFSLGAVDFIHKPISPPIVIARIQTHISLKRAADFLHDRNSYLEQEVQRRSQEAIRRAKELEAAHEATMIVLASLAETRDNDTGQHILRTQHYILSLASGLSAHPRFQKQIDAIFLNRLFKAAPLHDIGKVGIPDRILLKPGLLEEDEFEIMKTHTTLGYEAIQRALKQVRVNIPLLDIARDIALSHHEKWDGSGYPNGLSAEQIPLCARLMAVADVYDALVNRRVYKEPMTHAEALEIIVAGRGLHFDPDIVEVFVAQADDFQKIVERFSDQEEDL